MFKDNVFFLRNGLHTKINSYDSYILDSNIVIKFRELFYSPHKMSIDEVNYYIGLLEFFKDKDVVPGLAIQELSWDFENFNTDSTKFTRIVYAINSLFSYEDSTYSRLRLQNEFISDEQPIKKGKRKFNSLYLNADANIFLLPSFCVMLKYHIVLKAYSDNKIRYLEICKFLMNTLKLVGAYELSLITELLFSSENSKTKAINSMLKVGYNDDFLKNIWNSCWDIFFLRFITGFAANTLSNDPIQQILNPILVTRDNNLYTVGSLLENHNEVIMDGRVFPGVSGGYEYPEDVIQLISQMNYIITLTSKERVDNYKSISEIQQIDHWKKIIKELEVELINVYR